MLVSARLLADKVVTGAEPDVEGTREYAESSPSIVAPLNRYLGYERLRPSPSGR